MISCDCQATRRVHRDTVIAILDEVDGLVIDHLLWL